MTNRRLKNNSEPKISWPFIANLALAKEWDAFDISILYHLLRGKTHRAIARLVESTHAEIHGRVDIMAAQLGIVSTNGIRSRRPVFLNAIAAQPHHPTVVFAAETLNPVFDVLGITGKMREIAIHLCHTGAATQKQMAGEIGCSEKSLTDYLYALFPALGLPPTSKDQRNFIFEAQAMVRARLYEYVLLGPDLARAFQPAKPRLHPKIKEAFGKKDPDYQKAVAAIAKIHHIEPDVMIGWWGYLNGFNTTFATCLFPGQKIGMIQCTFRRISQKLFGDGHGREAMLAAFDNEVLNKINDGFLTPAFASYCVLRFAKAGLCAEDLKICQMNWMGFDTQQIAEQMEIPIFKARTIQCTAARALDSPPQKNYDLSVLHGHLWRSYLEFKADTANMPRISSFFAAYAGLYGLEIGGWAALAIARPDMVAHRTPDGVNGNLRISKQNSAEAPENPFSLKGLSSAAIGLYAAVFDEDMGSLLALDEVRRSGKIERLYRFIAEQFEALGGRDTQFLSRCIDTDRLRMLLGAQGAPGSSSNGTSDHVLPPGLRNRIIAARGKVTAI